MGYVLNTLVPSCVLACPTSYYADTNNICRSCISMCDSCSDSVSCNACSSGKLLVDGSKICITSPCPTGFYANGVKCSLCKPECLTCSTGSTCSSCILDYTLNSNQCLPNCGNSIRDSSE